jgi:DNA-dependent RNA polymerase auxiliary subunit epsilon
VAEGRSTKGRATDCADAEDRQVRPCRRDADVFLEILLVAGCALAALLRGDLLLRTGSRGFDEGSAIFFGTIIATVTSYFMRPMQRPARQIIETIEYNLEHLEDLSVEELELLKETVDGFIVHMERLKDRAATER